MNKSDLLQLAKAGHAGAKKALSEIAALDKASAKNSSKPKGAVNPSATAENDLTPTLAAQLVIAKTPEFIWKDHPQGEYRFHPVRQWKLDFFFPVFLIGVEVEGGIMSHRKTFATSKSGSQYAVQSRHLTPEGFEEDILKYFEAEELGIRIIRVTPRMIRNGRALSLVLRGLISRGWVPPTIEYVQSHLQLTIQ